MSELAARREAALEGGGYNKSQLARAFFDEKGDALEPEKDRLCLNGLIAQLERLERADKRTRSVQFDIFGETVPIDYEMAVPVVGGEESGEEATVEHKRYDRMTWAEFVAHTRMVLAQISRDQERAAAKSEIVRYGRDAGADGNELLVTVLARLRPH